MLNTYSENAVDDVAAMLFWSSVKELGYISSCEEIVQTEGKAALLCQNAANIISSYGICNLPAQVLNEFLNKVTESIFLHTLNKVNLIGVVYMDDLLTGRSPSAEKIDFSCLNNRVEVTGDTLPSFGKLCIRSPLPSVVVSDCRPDSDYFKIKDTSALGFKYPIFMSVQSVRQLYNSQWLITGIFNLPENPSLSSTKWVEFLPNSLSSRDSVTLNTIHGAVSMRYVWGVNNPGHAKDNIKTEKRTLNQCLGHLKNFLSLPKDH